MLPWCPAWSPSPRWAAAALLLVLSLVLTGCGGGNSASRPHQQSSATATTGTAAASDASLPQPSKRCGTPNAPATTLRFSAGDGTKLDGAIVGSGPVGVVLLHEYPGPMCGRWPYTVYLAHHGIHAILFDFRCLGLSACPRQAEGDEVADVAERSPRCGPGARARSRWWAPRSAALPRLWPPRSCIRPPSSTCRASATSGNCSRERHSTPTRPRRACARRRCSWSRAATSRSASPTCARSTAGCDAVKSSVVLPASEGHGGDAAARRRAGVVAPGRRGAPVRAHARAAGVMSGWRAFARRSRCPRWWRRAARAPGRRWPVDREPGGDLLDGGAPR